MAFNTSIVLYIACGFILILAVWMILTEIRLKKIFKGKSASDLEETIQEVVKSIGRLEGAKEDIAKMLVHHDKRIQTSIRGVEISRFNPFQEAGSNQSFAIALLNEEGDGIVLSSLYSRDRMSIFAKPIKKNSSEFELTEEEKGVVKKAGRA